MKQHTAYEGRIVPSLHDLLSCTIKSEFSLHCSLYLSISLLALAAFTCGCSQMITDDNEEIHKKCCTKIQIEWENNPMDDEFETLDIFTFNDDSLGYLDSYQRIKELQDNQTHISSTSGKKKITICSNLRLGDEEIASINSINDLERHSYMLEDLRRSAPFMIGTAITDTRTEDSPVVRMKPMTSEIVLKSVRSCFTGTPYAGEHITEAKVYLINVNAQCHLTDSKQEAQRFINIGMLNNTDMEPFKESDLIIQRIEENISDERLDTDISLVCFHNFCEDESPGSPFTRMVLEGRIQGTTYYWPVTINRSDTGQGVKNNTRHVFDLTIRRKGSLNPDEELSVEDCKAIMEIEQWRETDGYTVKF